MRSANKLLIAVALLAILAASCQSSAQNAAPRLEMPVDCVAGQNCLVQKLVDHDPGPGRQDHRCGLLTTDGHDGVDIRLRTMQDMETGFGVVAAASGTVLRIRDGEPDISSRVRTERNGRDAGNGVVIDHGDGWETQYSHLRQGSVAVRPGQRVATGDRLGQIGMSGNSEFPHLHFSVRHNGKAVDPFTGSGIAGTCDPTAVTNGLWSAAAARALAYKPSAVIAAGLASAVPPRDVAERGDPPHLQGKQMPLLLWVDAMGALDGDMQSFAIVGPDGKAVHVQETRVARGGLSWFAYSGKRAPPNGWLPGRYTGSYKLKRGGQIVAQIQIQASLE
jgi:murein DD-endopeptidase MepM/ murein hydrolase activator NlpD